MLRRRHDPNDPDHWTNPQDDPGDFPDIRVLGGNHPDLALDTYSTRCAGSDCLVHPAAHHVVCGLCEKMQPTYTDGSHDSVGNAQRRMIDHVRPLSAGTRLMREHGLDV